MKFFSTPQRALIALTFAGLCSGSDAMTQAETADDQETISGEQLAPELLGEGIIESWAQVLVRAQDTQPYNNRLRNDEQGQWIVPKPRATFQAHSGEHYITNKWGDVSMGIGFPTAVDVQGAWIVGQAGDGVWPQKLRVEGYSHGEQVAVTDWFDGLTAEPQWLAMDLEGVDRIVFVAEARVDGAAWYGVDDLTFSRQEDGEVQSTVLDFDDLDWGASLTSSGYAGLDWEVGTGAFEAMPAPGSKIDQEEGSDEDQGPSAPAPLGPGATAPTVLMDFEGVERGQNGQFSFPPDTHGAIGPNHYVIAVNRNFAIYNKSNGNLVSSVSLGAFQPNTSGDPRVLFDQISDRWIVVSTNFNNRIFLAVSMTDNPSGAWFKTSFIANSGSNAGCFPDFPTLGYDENGIYISAQLFGSCGATIWAIDKAPLISGSPSLGTVTSFANLSFEAIHACETYGSPGVGYMIARRNSSNLRLRRVNPPLTNPTLTTIGNVGVPFHSGPPDAPGLGANTPLDTGDGRLSNAVYRDGRIYTSHTINSGGRAAARWYEISTATNSVLQSGTVNDPSLAYYHCSIAVNGNQDIALGFTGSNSTTSPSCFLTSRTSTDTPGQMAAPILYRSGSGSAYNLIDGAGRNRWGDYSMTTVDPSDDYTFWTIQEYVKGNNDWDTWVGSFDSNSESFPEIYCAPKLSSAFCINIVGTSNPNGQPVSGNSDYAVTCFDVQGLKNGLLFASISGPANLPFNGGTLCVAPPTKRGPLMNSGGTGISTCDGGYFTIVNDGLIVPFGLDAGAGNSGWYQYWYRDPQNGAGNAGSSLSNAVELSFQ